MIPIECERQARARLLRIGPLGQARLAQRLKDALAEIGRVRNGHNSEQMASVGSTRSAHYVAQFVKALRQSVRRAQSGRTEGFAQSRLKFVPQRLQFGVVDEQCRRFDRDVVEQLVVHRRDEIGHVATAANDDNRYGELEIVEQLTELGDAAVNKQRDDWYLLACSRLNESSSIRCDFFLVRY